MKKTTNLNLPVYDTPSIDTFKLDDWNTANETIDYVFGEFKNGATNNAIDITARQGVVDVNTQLAEIAKIEPNNYYVGANQKYKTISDAVSAWTTAGKPPSIIYISKGIYNEKVNLQSVYSSLSFIGEDKTHVIWKQTKGYYPDCPLTISGDCVIKNITFIADHTDTPNYAFTDYTTGNTGGAYALHIDAPNAPGLVRVENCDLISYQNSALGSGTCHDRELRLENCNLYSYNNFASKTNGALLYHADNLNGSTGQKFVLKNNNLFNQYYSLVLFINNIGDTKVDAEFINNTLISGTYTNNADLTSVIDTTLDFNVTNASHGNTAISMDGIVGKTQKAVLTNADSTCIMYVTDFNEMQGKSCIFKGNSALGTSNTPVADHAFLGFSISYSNLYYTVQIAYDTSNGMKPYKRYWLTSSWTSWIEGIDRVDSVQSLIQTMIAVSSIGGTRTTTSADDIDISGYYLSGTGTPTADNYFIHHIKYTTANAIQEAWNFQGVKYIRRKYTTWSAWQLVSPTSQTTANRPIVGNYVGLSIFDTTLGKPIWCKTAGSSPVWVDATGTVV